MRFRTLILCSTVVANTPHTLQIRNSVTNKVILIATKKTIVTLLRNVDLSMTGIVYITRNILECDQSNVLVAHYFQFSAKFLKKLSKYLTNIVQ